MITPAYPDSPRRYRAKPVVIDARQLTEHNRHEVGRWCKAVTMYYEGLDIETLEGVMRADLGDWIIKGTRGEFYPCKPDVFATKYEEVVETSMTGPEPERMAEPKNVGAVVMGAWFDALFTRLDRELNPWVSLRTGCVYEWVDIPDPQPYQNCTLTADDPEPPVGSVVRADAGLVSERGVERWNSPWYTNAPTTWAEVADGSVTLLYRGEA